MQVFINNNVPIKAWIDGVDLEEEARKQLDDVASLPFIFKHIAVMPDCHWGIGATIGTVLPTVGAIVPAAVGVDIGCGMVAVKVPGIRMDDVYNKRQDIRGAIEKAVPHGRTNNGGKGDRGAWGEGCPEAIAHWSSLEPGYAEIVYSNPRIGRWGDPRKHLGSLGSGNHFIEVCYDEEGSTWVMLHSGSRGIGNRIGTYFINVAMAECEKWYVNVPSKYLAYLPEGTEYFNQYVQAVGWAQDFASQNRAVMMGLTLKAIRSILKTEKSTRAGDTGEVVVDCHHNYVQKEHHFGKNIFITRKGAIRARTGDLGIIPGTMGTPSFIVEGLGNPDSFHSCSHGAGRIMSRKKAKTTFTVEDHIEATKTVECRKDESVLDETPGAYKDINDVMKAQEDLVKVRHTLNAIICVKG